NSFEAQKSFVSNISHEIRTPLAAIITELELSVHKEQSPEEYRAALENALKDARRLVRLSNNLLDFAKASYDLSEITFKELRVDEILLDAMQQVKRSHPEYNMDIRFEDGLGNETETLVC